MKLGIRIENMAKMKIPTQEEIEALKSDFTSELNAINKAEKEGKSSPKRNFLNSISKEIKSSIENGTTYVGIKTAIKKVYNVSVSTQIIADFAHSELGIPKRKKSAVATTVASKDKVVKSSLELKQEMAKKTQDEDSL